TLNLLEIVKEHKFCNIDSSYQHLHRNKKDIDIKNINKRIDYRISIIFCISDCY
ncbi:unnamed protein product, partial (macronuclear) [Paramecium tetraurelia]